MAAGSPLASPTRYDTSRPVRLGLALSVRCGQQAYPDKATAPWTGSPGSWERRATAARSASACVRTTSVRIRSEPVLVSSAAPRNGNEASSGLRTRMPL